MEISNPNITLTRSLLLITHRTTSFVLYTQRTRHGLSRGEEGGRKGDLSDIFFLEEERERDTGEGVEGGMAAAESDEREIRCLIIVRSSLSVSQGSTTSLKAHLYFHQTPPPLSID